MFELLQYRADADGGAAATVDGAAEVNRYYVSTSHRRSSGSSTRSERLTTSMRAGRNPREELGHGRWALRLATLRAIEIVKNHPTNETSMSRGCAGDMTEIRSPSRAGRQGTVGQRGDIYNGHGRPPVRVLGMLHESRRTLDSGRGVSRSFRHGAEDHVRVLRPIRALIFNYVVSGWLLGEHRPLFDVLPGTRTTDRPCG